MNVYFTFRNHFKTIKVVHLGFNASGCIDALHFGISVSLIFVTIGLHIYKKVEQEEELKGMPLFSERDWKEDFVHENGNYVCQCYKCKEYFYGHKRRVECKICANEQEEEKKEEYYKIIPKDENQ